MAQRSTVIAAFCFLALSTPAVADSIDGNWCDRKGKTMRIEGSDLTMPNGRHVQGRYSRHNFSYVTPESEARAGATVSLALVGENTIRSAVDGTEDGVWFRCEQTSALPEVRPLIWQLLRVGIEPYVVAPYVTSRSGQAQHR